MGLSHNRISCKCCKKPCYYLARCKCCEGQPGPIAYRIPARSPKKQIIKFCLNDNMIVDGSLIRFSVYRDEYWDGVEMQPEGFQYFDYYVFNPVDEDGEPIPQTDADELKRDTDAISLSQNILRHMEYLFSQNFYGNTVLPWPYSQWLAEGDIYTTGDGCIIFRNDIHKEDYFLDINPAYYGTGGATSLGKEIIRAQTDPGTSVLEGIIRGGGSFVFLSFGPITTVIGGDNIRQYSAPYDSYECYTLTKDADGIEYCLGGGKEIEWITGTGYNTPTVDVEYNENDPNDCEDPECLPENINETPTGDASEKDDCAAIGCFDECYSTWAEVQITGTITMVEIVGWEDLGELEGVVPIYGPSFDLTVSDSAKMFSDCDLIGGWDVGSDTYITGPCGDANFHYAEGTFVSAIGVTCDGAGTIHIIKILPGCGALDQYGGEVSITIDENGVVTSATGGLDDADYIGLIDRNYGLPSHPEWWTGRADPDNSSIEIVIDSGSWDRDPVTGACFKLDEDTGGDEETPVAVCGGGTQDCFTVNGVCYPEGVSLSVAWQFGVEGDGNMFVVDPTPGGQGKILDKWETSGSGTDGEDNEFAYTLNNNGINGFSILLTYDGYTILLKFDKDGTYQPQMASWTGTLPAEYDTNWFLGLGDMALTHPTCEIAVPPEA